MQLRKRGKERHRGHELQYLLTAKRSGSMIVATNRSALCLSLSVDLSPHLLVEDLLLYVQTKKEEADALFQLFLSLTHTRTLSDLSVAACLSALIRQAAGSKLCKAS